MTSSIPTVCKILSFSHDIIVVSDTLLSLLGCPELRKLLIGVQNSVLGQEASILRKEARLESL